MGGSSYSFNSRTLRSESLGYATKSADEIFEQNRKRMIHESMEPKKAILRESRDSDTHPNSVPIILALDVTGSMGMIPHHLVKEGLPKMMANIIQRGVLDPQILFLAIGDHETDKYPLQVGQFESGDEELDLWLTRTYIEGGGGNNAGESYPLAWYFGANHTVTDSFEKRGQKGFIFTIGDEPCLSSIPTNAINEIMGVKPQSSYTEKELLTMAQEKYNVYHLHILEGHQGKRSHQYWKNLLGQNCVDVEHYQEVGNILAEIVVNHVSQSPSLIVSETNSSTPVTVDTTSVVEML